MKKAILAAAAFLATASAFAAPNIISGTNQNGQLEAVGTDSIYQVSHASGVTSYKSGGTAYTIQDSGKTRHDKIVASFGANAIVYAGTTFDGAQGKVTCQFAGSQISWRGVGNPETLTGDGCAYHQLAVAAGQAN